MIGRINENTVIRLVQSILSHFSWFPGTKEKKRESILRLFPKMEKLMIITMSNNVRENKDSSLFHGHHDTAND